MRALCRTPACFRRGPDIYRVHDLLSKRGWHLNALQRPAALHICFTAAHSPGIVELLLKDLGEVVAQALKARHHTLLICVSDALPPCVNLRLPCSFMGRPLAQSRAQLCMPDTSFVRPAAGGGLRQPPMDPGTPCGRSCGCKAGPACTLPPPPILCGAASSGTPPLAGSSLTVSPAAQPPRTLPTCLPPRPACLPGLPATLAQDPKAGGDGKAPLYGMAATVPDRRIVSQFLTAFQDALLEPV